MIPIIHRSAICREEIIKIQTKTKFQTAPAKRDTLLWRRNLYVLIVPAFAGLQEVYICERYKPDLHRKPCDNSFLFLSDFTIIYK